MHSDSFIAIDYERPVTSLYCSTPSSRPRNRPRRQGTRPDGLRLELQLKRSRRTRLHVTFIRRQNRFPEDASASVSHRDYLAARSVAPACAAGAAGRARPGRGRGQPGGPDVLAVASEVESLGAVPASVERG